MNSSMLVLKKETKSQAEQRKGGEDLSKESKVAKRHLSFLGLV